VRAVLVLGAANAALFWGARRVARAEARRAPRRIYRFALILLLLVALAERVTYAVGEARSDAQILVQADSFPAYFPITARKRVLAMGIGTRRERLAGVHLGSSRLAYPLAPIRVESPREPWNVVWLVGESLRWDALDPEVMPTAWELARDGWR